MSRGGRPSRHGTHFAPPERATPAEVNEQVAFCLDDPVARAVLEAVDSYAVVLNPQRQILAANPALLDALSGEVPGVCQGLRLGEALGCIRATEGPNGCGTSEACRQCGAVLSILATQDTGQASTGECLISLKRGGRLVAREFMARSFPLVVAGHRLTLLTLQDISSQKRRETLERIFIHDLRDSLQGMRGWTELLQSAGTSATSIAERILDMAGHLTAEVEFQRRLLQAERGELVPDLRMTTPERILDELEASLGAEVVARVIRLPHAKAVHPLRTDPAILLGILSSMIMNAVEALPLGGQAQVWYERHAGRTTFVVQNPGCLTREVAERVFQRSFSTKAERGRGLGTYSMKLLGETVLGGKVGFHSDWANGTRFFIELPGGT